METEESATGSKSCKTPDRYSSMETTNSRFYVMRFEHMEVDVKNFG